MKLALFVVNDVTDSISFKSVFFLAALHKMKTFQG